MPARRVLVPEELGLFLPPREGHAWSMDVLAPCSFGRQRPHLSGVGGGAVTQPPPEERAERDGSGLISVLMETEYKSGAETEQTSATPPERPAREQLGQIIG